MTTGMYNWYSVYCHTLGYEKWLCQLEKSGMAHCWEEGDVRGRNKIVNNDHNTSKLVLLTVLDTSTEFELNWKTKLSDSTPGVDGVLSCTWHMIRQGNRMIVPRKRGCGRGSGPRCSCCRQAFVGFRQLFMLYATYIHAYTSQCDVLSVARWRCLRKTVTVYHPPRA